MPRRSPIFISVLVFGIIVCWTLLFAPLSSNFISRTFSMNNDLTQDSTNDFNIETVRTESDEPELKINNDHMNAVVENTDKNDEDIELEMKNVEIAKIPGIDDFVEPTATGSEIKIKADEILSDLNILLHKYPHHNDDLADKLYNEVKVLCWVNTWPANHKTKAKAVKETWGKRCNKLVFISTEYDEYLDSVALPLENGRKHLWSKIRGAFEHIYDNYYDDYDWFVRADDDT